MELVQVGTIVVGDLIAVPETSFCGAFIDRDLLSRIVRIGSLHTTYHWKCEGPYDLVYKLTYEELKTWPDCLPELQPVEYSEERVAETIEWLKENAIDD